MNDLRIGKCSRPNEILDEHILPSLRNNGNFYQLFPDGRIHLSEHDWERSGTVDMRIFRVLIKRGLLHPIFVDGGAHYYADEVERLIAEYHD